MVTRGEYTDIIEFAWSWLMNEYGLNWKLKNLNIQFNFVTKSIATKPRANIKIYKEGKPEFNIRIISDRKQWQTYAKKTTGMSAERINCSNYFAILIQLIHELTHVIQYIHPEYNAGSEVGTTRNEFKFAYQHFFHYFKQCKPLIDKRKLPNYENREKPRCVIR